MKLTIHETPKDIIKEWGGDGEVIREQIKASGCWGFIDGDTVHLYYRDNVSDRDIVELLAHEMSHRDESIIRALEEDDFATQNAATFLQAYDLFRKIRK